MPAPRQINTHGIVLRRVNYGEADRIVTFLTPDQGKITAIAKGVRKSKSRMAGGIELFSISEIGFIKGKSDMDTLTSTRLIKYFSNIVKEMTRSDAAYSFIKLIDKTTEDNPETAYFNLLAESYAALDDETVTPELTRLWFNLNLLKTTGHAPDFDKDTAGDKLMPYNSYNFDLEAMKFILPGSGKGSYSANHIKFLRLGIAAEKPHLLQRVNGAQAMTDALANLTQSMLSSYVRL